MELRESIEKCYAMWKWIIEQLEAKVGVVSVDVLKKQWLMENDPNVELDSDCYFCEYDVSQDPDFPCQSCPLGLGYSGCTLEGHSWVSQPQAFFALIEKLYKKHI